MMLPILYTGIGLWSLYRLYLLALGKTSLKNGMRVFMLVNYCLMFFWAFTLLLDTIEHYS